MSQTVRPNTFRTVDACHAPPREVLTLRAFSAAAISRSTVETRADLAEAAQHATVAERDALRADLAIWASGNPLARAWRAFRYRRR